MDYQAIGGLKLRQCTPDEVGEVEAVVKPRRREDTAPRQHVFLRQTVPPNDPVVREVERWRSGSD